MHVLIIPSWYPTPDDPLQGPFFREQAHALKNAGLRVGVIAPQLESFRNLLHSWKHLKRSVWGWPPGERCWDDDGVSTWLRYGWSFPLRVLCGMEDSWLKVGRSLFDRYVSKHGMPDVVHAHCAILAGFLAARIKQRHGIPYVLTEHNSSYARDGFQPRHFPMIETALARADARVFVSRHLGETVESKFGELARPWIRIPNVIDTRLFSPDLLPVKESGAARLLFVGSLIEVKGISYLLDALAQLRRQRSDWHLDVVGNGSERAKHERSVKELGLSDAVVFHGRKSRQEVSQWMRRCDLFVLPSLEETFSVVTAEALATGTPVLATRCGGPEEIITEESGMLVPPRDASALAAALGTMIDRLPDYDRAAMARRVNEEYGHDTVTRMIRNVYSQVTSTEGAQG